MAHGPLFELPSGISTALGTFEEHSITVATPGEPVVPGNPVFCDGPASHIVNALFGETILDTHGPLFELPAGISTALNTLQQHEIPGEPVIPSDPVIPGNPVFGAAPASLIINELFGFHDTTLDGPAVEDVLGVAALHHDLFV